MSKDVLPSRVAEMLEVLPAKDKQPASAKVLDAWISHAQGQLGIEAQGGRLGWLIASSVAIAAVQRALDSDGRHLFLLKGGTLLQHRLNSVARATKDIGGLIRGDLDAFFVALEGALALPWGPISLRRGEVEEIHVPTKLINPRRFNIYLEIRGVTWRKVVFEVSPDEARIGEEHEHVIAPPLSGFGLPDSEVLVGIALKYQIAQKLHAVSDPHEPPGYINDRPRDVIDLLLLRDLVDVTGHPTLDELREAAVSVFTARSTEAALSGLPVRQWPPVVTAHDHWAQDYSHAAASAEFDLSLADAIEELNLWVLHIDSGLDATHY